MTVKNIVQSSALGAWLMRLASSEDVAYLMRKNPVLFATWYSMVEPALSFNDEVSLIQHKERKRTVSLSESLALLEKLNHNVSGSRSTEQVRNILEGYAVHEWVVQHPTEFADVVREAAAAMEEGLIRLQSIGVPLHGSRVQEFAEAMGLTPVETGLLAAVFMCGLSSELKGFLTSVLESRTAKTHVIWSTLLRASFDELREATAAQGILRTSRILSVGFGKDIPTLSDFWLDALSQESESLLDLMVKPLSLKPGAGLPATLARDDEKLAIDILKNALSSKAVGINLLLYGADLFEKRSQLITLLESVGTKAFVLLDTKRSWSDLGTIAYVAQRYLAKVYGDQAILVLEEPGKVLERQPSEFLRNLLGIEGSSSPIAPLDELLLETNPVPCIWAGAGSQSLVTECISRFVFHAPLKKANRADRTVQLERAIKDLKLTRATQKELLSLEDVSALQLQTALRAAALSGGLSREERENALLRSVKRSLAALQRDTAPAAKECVTEYSLKYLNHTGKFGPEQILKALKLRPKGSICLYGPPGTGKTQFVEHLAQSLGIRLIAKRASDLLSKWVGENEKNISAMFQEAEAEEAILFLDEGDSFLQDRGTAGAGWEVTKVNELLQCMERFPGIFIVATNLFRGLDSAALRRFTFKLELRPLKPEQRWEMFVTEAGLKGSLSTATKAEKESWRGSLALMHQLAAGDFATVKRQCVLLGETLTPAQWIEQLQIECDVKLNTQASTQHSPAEPEGFGTGLPKIVH